MFFGFFVCGMGPKTVVGMFSDPYGLDIHFRGNTEVGLLRSHEIGSELQIGELPFIADPHEFVGPFQERTGRLGLNCGSFTVGVFVAVLEVGHVGCSGGVI